MAVDGDRRRHISRGCQRVKSAGRGREGGGAGEGHTGVIVRIDDETESGGISLSRNGKEDGRAEIQPAGWSFYLDILVFSAGERREVCREGAAHLFGAERLKPDGGNLEGTLFRSGRREFEKGHLGLETQRRRGAAADHYICRRVVLAGHIGLLCRNGYGRTSRRISGHCRCRIGRIERRGDDAVDGEPGITGPGIAVVGGQGVTLRTVDADPVTGLPEGWIAVAVLFAKADLGIGKRSAELGPAAFGRRSFRNFLLFGAGESEYGKARQKYSLFHCFRILIEPFILAGITFPDTAELSALAEILLELKVEQKDFRPGIRGRVFPWKLFVYHNQSITS